MRWSVLLNCFLLLLVSVCVKFMLTAFGLVYENVGT
jgi:hypothetical protein